MKDQKELHFTPSDKRDLSGLCDELDRLQKQCKDILWNSMVSRVIKIYFLSQYSQQLQASTSREFTESCTR